MGREQTKNPFGDIWVLVRGGGEIVSGAIQRLNWSGFPTVVTELERPLVVRRLVSFANAVFMGECDVEGTLGKRVENLAEAKLYVREQGGVPILVDPEAQVLHELNPTVLIDGRMAKRPLDTRIGQAPIVIGLGPGLEVGRHCDAAIETKGGSRCGYAYFEGRPIENTGTPCVSAGFTVERVLRAPRSGRFQGCKEIGDYVDVQEVVGWVNDEPVRAQISGILRGLIYSGLEVAQGLKLGDIDHRGESSDCCRVSEKADSVATGVLEAIFHLGLEKGIFSPPTSGLVSGI